jgi:hypothetical protein
MVVCGDVVAVPPLPRHGLRYVSVGGDVVPVHPKSLREVCISCNGLVTGCHSFVAGIDHVASCCSSGPRLELVKSVKTKPPQVMTLVWPSFRVASGRHCGRARLAA